MGVSEVNFMAALHAAQIGDAKARDRLFTFLYDELRRMAQRELRRGAPVALSATTLLHETFLNMSQRNSLRFSTRGEFMSYASRAMRGLIVDHLRTRHAEKRGGQVQINSLSAGLPLEPAGGESIEMEKLSDALESLEKIDPRLAECVDLKFFCGFSFAEIAQLRDVSERTVQRDWDKARLLLNRFISDRENEWQAAS
jgi:RNA polymerase sigma factor (TIGR02999 family)